MRRLSAGPLVLFVGIALLGAAMPALAFYDVPATLISLTSPEGAELIDRSWPYNADFFNISSHIVTQENQAFCGIATFTTILNALGVPAPELFPGFPYYVQNNLFSAATERVVRRADIEKRGMEMAEWEAFARAFPGVKAKAHYGNETSLEALRGIARRVFASSGSFVAINFLRSEMGEIKGGHWSPAAAYDEESDRVLIMDVARFKYPPVWVKLETLLRSMNTRDGARHRGLVIVTHGEEKPVPPSRSASAPVAVRSVGGGGFVATGVLSFLAGIVVSLGAWWYTQRRAVGAAAASNGAAFFDYKSVGGATPSGDSRPGSTSNII
eukprot:tig00000204_g17751.t1